MAESQSKPPSESGTQTAENPAEPSAPATPAATPSAENPPTPAPTKLALATALRSAVASALAPIGCSLVHGEAGEPGGTVTLTGVAGQGAPEAALHRAITDAAPTATVDWRVQDFEGPYCPTLDALRPIAYSAAARSGGFSMALRNGNRPLKDGELITVDVKTPDFPAWLLVDYFEHDGTVVHLHPTPKDPARSYAPDTRESFGDPTAGGERWEVGAPYGTDMVVALASSAPLFTRKRKDLEQTDEYLRALQAAIAAARRHDARLAVDAVVLKTGPRL